MLRYLLDELQGAGISRRVVVIGSGAEAVKAALPEVQFVLQEPQLGTGHAVLTARQGFADFEGDLVVLYGDVPLLRQRTVSAMLAAVSGEASADLEAFKAAGKALGICTNKPTALAEQLLEELGLHDYFGAVVGGDAVVASKPDPEHLATVIDSLEGKCKTSLFIGDSEVDLLAGQALGVPVILLTHGYSRNPLDGLGADDLFDNFAKLLEWVKLNS